MAAAVKQAHPATPDTQLGVPGRAAPDKRLVAFLHTCNPDIRPHLARHMLHNNNDHLCLCRCHIAVCGKRSAKQTLCQLIYSLQNFMTHPPPASIGPPQLLPRHTRAHEWARCLCAGSPVTSWVSRHMLPKEGPQCVRWQSKTSSVLTRQGPPLSALQHSWWCVHD